MHINLKAIVAMFKAMGKAGIGKAVLEFLKRNESTFVYGAGALGLGVLAKKMDIPLGDALKVYAQKDEIFNNFDEIQRMNSPKDEAIHSLMKSGCDTYYTREMIQAINGIKDLVTSSATDKSTATYAIRCINDIAASTYYSDVKKEAQKAILEIGKGGKTDE